MKSTFKALGAFSLHRINSINFLKSLETMKKIDYFGFAQKFQVQLHINQHYSFKKLLNQKYKFF